MRKAFFPLLFFLFAVSCAGAKTATGHVEHVVLVWLKDSGNKDAIKTVVKATKELEEIEGILSLRVGEAIPSDRSIVDDSFDVGIVMTFPSAKAMNAYLTDKRHVERVNRVLAPMSRKIVVYDIGY